MSFFQWLRGRDPDGVKLIIGDKCLGMLEAVGEVYPDAKYQRCTVQFYWNVSFVVHWSEDKRSEDKECMKKGYAMSLTMSYRHGGFTEFGLTVFRRLPDGRIVREK